MGIKNLNFIGPANPKRPRQSFGGVMDILGSAPVVIAISGTAAFFATVGPTPASKNEQPENTPEQVYLVSADDEAKLSLTECVNLRARNINVPSPKQTDLKTFADNDCAKRLEESETQDATLAFGDEPS